MHPFFIDRNLRYPAFLALGILLVASAWIAFTIQGSDHFLVLRLGAHQGPEFLGTTADLYRTIAVAALVALVNLGLASTFYSRIRFLSYLISYFNVFFASLILIGVGIIISVN